jgi:enoyl-CoA hydratase
MLAGEELDAQRMLATGFVDQLVAREELSAATDALAERLAGLAPLAIQAMKRILRGIAAGALDAGEIDELVRRCESSEDLKEGLLARREGRAAEFRGR